jgi:pilus assembly protein FimV
MGLLTPLSAVALGIGEIRLKSALNQNLNAEIGLILSENESVSDIRVNLASPDAFRRADIDLAYFLHGLSFEVVPKADGQFAIKVSSRDAIREPFLNFLVEVSWPQGRMQREFTLLLDPPTTFKKGIVTRTALHAVTPAADSPQPEAGDYGPVAAGESLWGISRKLSAGGAPSRRMMQEIFENNPHAFQRGNINVLKQGVTLKVPGGAQIAGVKPIPAKPAKELTLATPKQEGAGKAKPGTATKSEIALEVADTVRQENEEIRNRLAELEKQLATMQRLVSLKDQQIATLQSGQAGTQPPAVTPPAVPAEPALKPPPPSAAQPPAEPAPVPPAATQAPAPPVATPATATPAAQPATPPPPVQAQPSPPVEDTGLFGQASVMLVAGAFVLLGGFGVAIIRRRRAALLEIEEEEYAPATLLTSADNRPDKGRVAGLITPSQQGSFLSEFTPSDFDVLDSDNEAIDPLSEADVYLAYGRYQQAEELIKQAINENPFRDECKLKLLEVYYSAQNRQAFEQYASELADDGKSADREFWSRVTAMGSTFCSDSALFGGTRPTPAKPISAPAQEAMPIDSPQTALMDEKEFNLGVPEDLSSSLLTGAARVDSVVPVDASDRRVSPRRPGGAARVDSVVSVEADAHLTHDNAAVEETVPSLAEADEIEFDLSAFGTEDAGSEAAASEVEKSGAAAERALLEFDLSSFETSSLNEQGAGARPATTSASSRGDIASKIEFDAKTPVVESSDRGEVGDLTDMDEVETKLDLARAYVDMDDRQSARRLLEEIITEGNNQQQEEARAMLASLALVA